MILKCFRISEKAALLSSTFNQYTFDVAKVATADDVARAIFSEFGFKPVRVSILNQDGKLKRLRVSKRKIVASRKPAIKKAIVLLRDGDKIEIS
jgi:ribosomal protein L23